MREGGNVVLSATAFTPPAGEPERSERNVKRATLIRPADPLADAAIAIAHTEVTRDGTDGAVRELPMVVEESDRRLMPALSLAALAAAEGASPEPIVRSSSGVQVAGRAVPTNDDYELRVSYPPELSATTQETITSAADVLQGEITDDAFRDKIVFLGVTDVSLGDRLLTPVAKSTGLPGVLVHASAYDTMVGRVYLAPASTLEVVLLVLIISLIITFSVQFLPAWLAATVALAVFAVYVSAAYLRSDTGTIMNLTYPTIAVAIAVPLSGGVRYVVEMRHRRRVAALFSQYVPDRVASQLIDEGRVGAVTEGERFEVAAMFCDLRGFTERSSRMEPFQVNAMLSDFYEYGSEIVLAHEGTLMTYIGDEIFVIFGAPVPASDHATRALACARDLQEKVGELDSVLAPHGFEPLRFGIGIHAGEVVASHAGSTWRRQYTAIGDTVNIASRLCSRAGPGQVVLSEAVRERTVPPPCVTRLDSAPMKGVTADFLVWKLVLDQDPSGTRDR
jgi:adenylate cyclase